MLLRPTLGALALGMLTAGPVLAAASGVTLTDPNNQYTGSLTNPLFTQNAPAANAAGGLSVYRVSNVAGANGIVVKGSAGRLYAFILCNSAASTRYARFYDSAAPVPGTSAVYAGAITISAGSCQQFSTGFGLSFNNGIGLGVTGANGDTDTTPAAAGDVSGFVGFQ